MWCKTMFLAVGALACLVFSMPGVFACGIDIDNMFEQAVDKDPTVSQAAVSMLRYTGPAAVEKFYVKYKDSLSGPVDSSAAGIEAERIARIHDAFDSLCGQRNSYASRLFWYTDFEKAQYAARTQNKPVLSLRLLGNLTDEFSCANSRFFRTVLYADPDVSNLLRDNFILHWQSVRPVPKITIDYGDGRQLVRTITGNSIHYTLSSDGQILDAIPGLYHAKAFLNHLNQSIRLNNALSTQQTTLTVNPINRYHQNMLNVLHYQIEAEFPGSRNSATLTSQTAENEFPTAAQAAPLAMSKSIVELPMVTKLQLQNRGRFLDKVDDSRWKEAAKRRVDEIHLSQTTRNLMRSHISGSQAKFDQTVANFKQSLAMDSLRNEYIFHRQIHQWFVEGKVTNDVAKLNQRVYADLFLTPDEDPWLGLLSKHVYSAIANNGVITQATAQIDEM